MLHGEPTQMGLEDQHLSQLGGYQQGLSKLGRLIHGMVKPTLSMTALAKPNWHLEVDLSKTEAQPSPLIYTTFAFKWVVSVFSVVSLYNYYDII